MASTPVPHTSDDEPDRTEHREPTGREVLAHLDFGPAFPGILDDLDSDTRETENPSFQRQRHLVVNLGTARWIGVLLEAHYGSAQVKFNWHADTHGLPVLAIEDDPWEVDPQEQPRLVYPDARGRYALADCWAALTDEQAADWMNNHAAVIDELSATEPSPDVPTSITGYLLLGQAYRHFDPDGNIRRLRRALDDYADRQSVEPIVEIVATSDFDLD